MRGRGNDSPEGFWVRHKMSALEDGMIHWLSDGRIKWNVVEWWGAKWTVVEWWGDEMDCG